MEEACANKVELQFPLSLTLKIVMDKTLSLHQAKSEILKLFTAFHLTPKWKGARESSKGRYISYSVFTTLESLPQMRSLYEELGKMNGVKLIL